MTWDVDASQRMAFVYANGVIDLAGTIEAMVNLAGEPDFRPAFAVLVDLRKMEYAPEMREVLEIGSAVVTMKELFRGRVAVVAESSLHFHLVQISTAMASVAGLDQKAFRDLDKARSWLEAGKATG